ncbi:MAG: hypothetical protein JW929_03990 [Anaerolineales bacterium]|nr:hypothetical protein [Anaerolineales bacterium]
MFFIALMKTAPARAQAADPCEGYPVKVTFPDKEEFGFEITLAKKTTPEYPIVIGQDMEEQTGVSITVEIASLPMTVTYWAPVEVEECVEDRTRRGYDDDCPPHYFLTKVRKCVEVKGEPVRRTIIGNSLKVWLEPSEETLDWLGWNIDYLAVKEYPLRYMFPEEWSLGTWTPEGYTTVGEDFIYTEEQIDALIAANPGFEFLKGDPRPEDIPTHALVRAQDPVEGAGKRVLALYGEFINWYTQGWTTLEGACLIERPGMKNARCQTATNLSQMTPGTGFFNADLDAPGITYLRLDLLNAPMDLPGVWYVGVSVMVNPAKYYNGQRLEPNWMNANTHIYPGHGYEKEGSKFTVYILISTLCNSAEIDGCTR